MFARISICLSLLAAAPSLSAQCGASWQGLSTLPGTNNPVWDLTTWDRDGAGPLPPLLVAGGNFDLVGPLRVGGLVAYDPSTAQWSSLGGGVSQPFLGSALVNTILPMPNGDLVVAGTFLAAGGIEATCIARWDGGTWHAYGDGIGGGVYALAVLPSGDLVAAGNFFFADGNVVSNIVRWDGTTWVSLGQGLNGPVRCLAVLPTGELVAGGSFTASGLAATPFLARWDGSTWSSFAGGMTGDVHALAVAPSGELYVAGGFVGAAGVNATGIARWDGTSWSSLGSGASNPVHAITITSNGDVVIGGLFVAVDGVAASRIARWNGSVWSPVGGGLTSGNVFAIEALPDGSLCLGGNFTNGDQAGTDHLLRFDGTGFGPLQRGTGGIVNTSRRLRSGDLVVGGSFRQLAGIAASGVARRTGTTWSALGAGVDGTVLCVLELANGELLVGGLFANAGGNAATNVARWNGSTWSPMGAGLPGAVHRLVQRPNGQIVASGAFLERVAVWNGTAWLGTGVASTLGGSFPARALAVLPNGDVAASALNLSSGAHHAVWNGASWTALSTLNSWAADYAVAQNGDLLAVGNFFPTPVRRWNGTAWSQVGSSGLVSATCLLELPNGDLLTGGGASGSAYVQRFDGATWTTIALGSGGGVLTFAPEADGSLFVGGSFTLLEGQVASRMARMTSNCPAGVLVAGGGCSGSGGVNALAATSLPWIGSTFRSTASGLPANGIAIELLGIAPTLLSLSSLLPEGGAGCNLLVTPVAFGLQVPSGGSVGLQFAVPNDAALVGTIVRQQVLAADFGLAGNLTALTASNALQLIVGAL